MLHPPPAEIATTLVNPERFHCAVGAQGQSVQAASRNGDNIGQIGGDIGQVPRQAACVQTPSFHVTIAQKGDVVVPATCDGLDAGTVAPVRSSAYPDQLSTMVPTPATKK
jgi:hypothetical protein